MKILLLVLLIVPLLSKFINQRLLGGTTPPDYANAPVIGVLSQPFTCPGSTTQEEFISLTNVRYLEQAGAKVIPISYTMATSDLLTLLGKINGVLFTGGGIDLVNTSTLEYHPYTVTSDTIFQYSINQTDKGDYFPIMGICQGFQLLNILKSTDKLVLKQAPAVIQSDVLNLMVRSYEESRLFSGMPENSYSIYSSNNVVTNMHNWGIYLADYLYNRTELLSFYKMITYEKDTNNRMIVTAIEAYNYPIYAVQFHPEKILYEFSYADGVVPKTSYARQLAEDIVFNFVDETRKSQHYFGTEAEQLGFLIQKKTYKV